MFFWTLKNLNAFFFQRKHNEYQFISKKPINSGKYSECKQFPWNSRQDVSLMVFVPPGKLGVDLVGGGGELQWHQWDQSTHTIKILILSLFIDFRITIKFIWGPRKRGFQKPYPPRNKISKFLLICPELLNCISGGKKAIYVQHHCNFKVTSLACGTLHAWKISLRNFFQWSRWYFNN